MYFILDWENPPSVTGVIGESIRFKLSTDSVFINADYQTEWGQITGDITTQTDLQTSLSLKADLGVDGKVLSTQLPTITFPVTSVNTKTGDVVLTATDVGADASGAADAVRDELQPQITSVTTLALLGTTSKNLINPSDPDVAIGYFPNNTTGNLETNSSYNTTGFISVTVGQSYTLTKKHYVTWYNASKVFISGTSDSDTNHTQVAPTGAAYMRASARNSSSDDWSGFQVELGTVTTDYEPYGLKLTLAQIKDNFITGAKLADAAVTPSKTSFARRGKNMFSKYSSVAGTYVGHDGSTGSSDILTASDFIAVTPSTQYYGQSGSTGFRFVCFYDQYKNFVAGGVNDGGSATKTFTTRANVRFVKITILSTAVSSFQLELGSAATAFEPFAYNLKGVNGEPFSVVFLDNAVATSALAAAAVTPSKTNFILPSKNLFNKATVTSGFISPANGSISASSTYDTSDYIAVLPSTTYYGRGSTRGIRFVAYYDANKVLISDNNNAEKNSITTLAGAYFVRISIFHSDLDSFQFELGSSQTGYVSYGYELKLADGTPITATVSTWSGKTWAALGDSITAGNNWQGYVVSAHGLSLTNYGVSGTKISGASGDTNAMCQDTRINAIPTTVDLITLMGGTNDWAQNVVLGAVDSTDPTTFNGALNTFAQKAFARWPSKRIAVATTPYGEIVDWTSRTGWTSPAKNSLGLTTNDYADAIRAFCKRANIHCIDVAMSGGYGTYNIEPALGGSTTDHLHPASGSLAAKGIGSVYISGLRQITPVA